MLNSLRLASRKNHPEDTLVDIGNNVVIGGKKISVIAGPCAVEGRDLYLEVARWVKKEGGHLLRGGAFKPRTSPYSFSGLGEEGLRILAAAREVTGLPVVTEVMDTRDVELVARYADVLQIGSRNMQNYALLREVAQTGRPVLLKRGFAATIKEWLLAAEYVLSSGNSSVILCERGIRTFETYTRNTIDIGGVVAVKEISHLPVIVDPSHGTGRASLVRAVARAAVAAGADGIMVEVHQNPDCALSDGFQSLTLEAFSELMQEIRLIAAAIGKALAAE